MTQYGFYLDSSKCTGCKTCQLACKDFKDLGTDRNFRRVSEYTGGEWKQEGSIFRQDVYAYYVSISCNHCDAPVCVEKCPTKAMHKRETDGLVAIHEDKCIACRRCQKSCPYGAPQFNKDKKKMSKCDGCFARVEQGLQPICVEACPLRALKFAPIAELRQQYGQAAEMAPLPAASQTKPNLVLKKPASAKPVGDTTGRLVNAYEL